MDNEKIFAELSEIIAEIAEEEAEDITGETNLAEDLGVDSVKALEIIVEIERNFKVKFDENDLSNIIKEIKTMNDAVEKTRQAMEAVVNG